MKQKKLKVIVHNPPSKEKATKMIEDLCKYLENLGAEELGIGESIYE